jgi:hypothetical protein
VIPVDERIRLPVGGEVRDDRPRGGLVSHPEFDPTCCPRSAIRLGLTTSGGLWWDELCSGRVLIGKSRLL